MPRAPLPGAGVTRHQGDLADHLRGHYSSFIAHTGSCTNPNFSFLFRILLIKKVFAGCCLPLLEVGPSRHYLCNPCVGDWIPTPPCYSGALTRFFPKDIGLTLRETRLAHESTPAIATSAGSLISGLQSFDHLQSPTLTWPPDRSHRSVPRTLSGRAFYTTHRPSGYPTRDVASLHDRHGQLSRLDFHQLDCSLGSCSFPHWAFRSSSPQGIRVRRYGAWIGIAYKPNSLYSLAVGHREHPW